MGSAPETLAGPTATLNSASQGLAPTSPRVAVLLVNFQQPSGGPPAEPWTSAAVDDLYFKGVRSVAAYYDEVSGGQMALSGDVFGYFTLATSTYRCEYNDWGTAARKAAARAGIDLTQYTNVVYAFPRQESCWWSGMSTVPGRNNWVNGELTTYVASHELGHNFGLDHAAALICKQNGVRVAYSSSCSLDEYGDPFDVMGFTGQRHFHSWHRMQLGLVAPEEVQTVTDAWDLPHRAGRNGRRRASSRARPEIGRRLLLPRIPPALRAVRQFLRYGCRDKRGHDSHRAGSGRRPLEADRHDARDQLFLWTRR